MTEPYAVRDPQTGELLAVAHLDGPPSPETVHALAELARAVGAHYWTPPGLEGVVRQAYDAEAHAAAKRRTRRIIRRVRAQMRTPAFWVRHWRVDGRRYLWPRREVRA